MIQLTVVGRVGADPTVNSVNNEKVAINFDLVHTERFKNDRGEMVERPTWVRASMFRKPEKTGVKDYIRKGDTVMVTGFPSASGYQDKEGKIQAGLNVRVKDLEFIHSKKQTV